MTEELWKDVVGREGEYQVSSLGRVRSLARCVNTWNGFKSLPDRILKIGLRNGYPQCGRLGHVHRLVARAFLPTDNYSLHINHKNGVRTDNRVVNLEWCTPLENARHAWKTGLCNDSTRAKMSAKSKLRTGPKNPCWRGYVNIYALDDTFLYQALILEEAAQWVRNNTKYVKASKGNISLACNNNRGINKMYGLHFKYSKEELKHERI